MKGNTHLEEYFEKMEEQKLSEEEKTQEEEKAKDDLFDEFVLEGEGDEEEKEGRETFTEGHINMPRPVSVKVDGNMADKNSSLEFDLDTLKSGTNYLKYTHEAYLSKILSFIPIQNRIYKIKST